MLPDVSAFERLDPSLFRALGARLRALGLNADAVAPVARICDRMLDPLAAPLRRYQLRKRTDVLAHAMRLFVFGDEVTAGEARGVLGELPLEALLDGGVVVAAGDGLVACPFLLNCMGALYVLCDDLAHGDEAVMGVSNTTADLCRAVRSDRPLARALDLGCGAGAAALALATRGQVVIATDINPRAIVFTQINALLNGFDNIDPRVGDMFAPVAGETFDLVVSQPPFVPRPEGAAAATFLYGGPRGDELPLRLLRELAPHLAPGGRAVVLIDWPVVKGDPIEARVRGAAPELSALLLTAPPEDLDNWSAAHAFLEERAIDERYVQRALLRRAHFDRMEIDALRLTFNVFVNDGKRWVRSVDILPASRAGVQESHIDALLATSAQLQSSDDELLGARLRLPSGAEIIERGGRVRVVFRELLPPIDLSRGAAMLATSIDGAETVADGLAKLAAQLGGGPTPAQMLAGVRQALSLDVLQPVAR